MASFFDRFTRAKETSTEIPGVTKVGEAYLVDSFSFNSNNTYYPEIHETTYGEIVPFGKNNLFPNELIDFYYSSPIHSTITNFKAKVMSGDGIDKSKLTPVESIKVDALLGDMINKKLSEISLDYQLIGACAIEVIWNMNFTAIAKINRIPISQVRLGKENAKGEVEEYFISKDWRKSITNANIVKIPRFDPLNKTSQSQLIYVKNPSVTGQYYGIPSYASGLNYIAANAAISKYHLSVVENGFNPGLAIKFFKKPQSPEERQTIVRAIHKEYGGKSNAGKVMILFSDGKDLAPEIQPIEVSNLDKQFTVLTEDITNQIIYSHQAVSPILYGIKTPGQLGNTGEFQNALIVLDRVVIQPERRVLEDVLNALLKINGVINPITIKPFVVFDQNLTTK